MTDRFLGTSGSTSNLSNGSANLYISSLGISGLSAGMPVKTNSVKGLVSQNLAIAEVDGLQAALNNTLQNPFNGTLQVVDLETAYNTIPVSLNTFISNTNGKLQNFTAVAGTTSFGNTNVDGVNISTSSIQTTGRTNFIQVASMGTPSAGRTILWADTVSRELYITDETGANKKLVTDFELDDYLTQADADTEYLKIDDAELTYLTLSDAALTYLTIANATSTYLSIVNAASTYLTQANASLTYLTQANAASTYLTQANATSTYLPLAGGTITGFLNTQSVIPTTDLLYSLGSSSLRFARLWTNEIDSNLGAVITFSTNTITNLAATQTLTASTVINLNTPSLLKQGVAVATATDLTGKVSRDGTLAMTAAFNVGGFKIINLATPTLTTDATTKTYVDSNFVPRTGAVIITGGLDTSDLNPRTNATYSLGTDTFRYINLKLTGIISNANGASINFAGANTMAILATTATLNGSPIATGATLGSYLPLAGGTMSGQINMGTQKIINLGTPTLGTDAVTKTYADLSLLKAGGTMTGQLVMPNSGFTTPVISPLANLTSGVVFNNTVSGFCSNGRTAFITASNPALGVGTDCQIGTASDAYTSLLFSSSLQSFSVINAAASNTLAIQKGLPATGTSLFNHNATTNTTNIGEAITPPGVNIISSTTTVTATGNINLTPTSDLVLGGTPYLVNPSFFQCGLTGAGTDIPAGANQLQTIGNMGGYTTLAANNFSIAATGVITYNGTRTQSFRVEMSFTFRFQLNLLATMTFYINKGTIVAPTNPKPKAVIQSSTNSLTNNLWPITVSEIFSLAPGDTLVGITRCSLASATNNYSNHCFNIINILN